jgi:hypothetical protein
MRRNAALQGNPERSSMANNSQPWMVVVLAAAVGAAGAVWWTGPATDPEVNATHANTAAEPVTVPTPAAWQRALPRVAAERAPAAPVPTPVRNFAAEEANLPPPPPPYQPTAATPTPKIIHPEVTDPEARRRLEPAWAD